MSTLAYNISPIVNAGPTADVCASVVHMLAETLRVEPPPHRAWSMPSDRARMPLGSYLLGYGYIRPRQLVQMLNLQQQSRPGEPRLLIGDLLVAHNIISPRVLATMLAMQLMDRLVDPSPFRPKRLGEHLISRGHIKPRPLAGVLQLQSWLRLQGYAVPLGALLVQQNLVHTRHIDEVLDSEQTRQA
jgi:hypothetical protein